MEASMEESAKTMRGSELFIRKRKLRRRGSHGGEFFALVGLLKNCTKLKDLRKGAEVHGDLRSKGLLHRGSSLYLSNTLIDMYAKCGAASEAQEVHGELRLRNLVTWNVLIAGYAQQALGPRALACFERMRGEGLLPDVVTFTCAANACGTSREMGKGKRIHCEIAGSGLLEKDIVLGNALLDMYVKCDELARAAQVLDELPVRDVVSWNALLTGYVQQGRGREALGCFRRMKGEGFSPDGVTFICILKACGFACDLGEGKEIHGWIVARGLLETDVAVGNCLVDMYAKCGVLSEARAVLEELPRRNEISWSTLIAGYIKRAQCSEALICFDKMRREGLSADAVAFTYALTACGSTGSIDIGTGIHEEIAAKGLLRANPVLGSALVNMYAKCGLLAKAQQVLEELPLRNEVSWSTLIVGYGEQGLGHEALYCFDRMLSEGLVPDAVSFLCLLNACGSSGLLDEARSCFASMSKRYGIAPSLDHHTCMVMVLGRAGHFDRAMSVIKTMPCSDHPPIWLAMLGSCRKWGNVELARLAFDEIVRLDSSCAGAYALMADIYTAAGLRDDAAKVEALRAMMSCAQMNVGADDVRNRCERYGSILFSVEEKQPHSQLSNSRQAKS